jgi:hypothetical protein
LVTLVEGYCPLGPLIWAAVGKDTSRNPLEIIRGIRQNAFGYSDEEIRSVRMDNGPVITRDRVRNVLEPALDRAVDYCEETAPVDFQGYLLVDKGLVPGEATDEDLQERRYEALPLKDFSSIPSFQ